MQPCSLPPLRARGRGFDAWVFRQQGRVDVDQPVRPRAHKKRRQHTHEPGERDHLDIVLDQQRVEVAFERFTILAVWR